MPPEIPDYLNRREARLYSIQQQNKIQDLLGDDSEEPKYTESEHREHMHSAQHDTRIEERNRYDDEVIPAVKDKLRREYTKKGVIASIVASVVFSTASALAVYLHMKEEGKHNQMTSPADVTWDGYGDPVPISEQSTFDSFGNSGLLDLPDHYPSMTQQEKTTRFDDRTGNRGTSK